MLYATSKVMLAVALGINLLAFIGKVAVTGSLLGGLLAVLAWFNPGNTVNFVGEVVLFSPAVFAYLLAEYLDRASREPR
jgi:hypothetical protein